ncbi:MAG: DUF1552 domain-containing protein [Nannocystaceae bacterium]|nr:DUF1552 domain-containing protein [Nannocystaceae bacterium]
MKISRRHVLRGAGGVAVTLPFLEGLAPREAKAAEGERPFAIFFRQANGVASAQNTEVGNEPERFWPTQLGALTEATMGGRAVGELVDFADKLLIVRNCNMNNYDFGDGHARGAMQGLVARGAAVAGAGGSSEASGESIDHRIGRELNPDGRDSLFMYAGSSGGWLGGPCISYRGSADRRSALHNPATSYQTMMGVDAEEFGELIARQKSVNDLVRDQMDTLLASSKLSGLDKTRLELHRAAIRDLESSLSCNLEQDAEMELDGMSAGYDSDDGIQVLNAARAHMKVAALAVSCGYTRSVAIQVGSGNDGSTRYENLGSGGLMENYHFLSHRRSSHDSSGAVIANSDVLHSYVDIQFARAFNFLLEELDQYLMPNGDSALNNGVAIWYNDNGNGPGHSPNNIPYVIGGSACGYFKQGQNVELSDGGANHRKMLQTIGTAVGLTTNGGPLDDFGDPGLDGGILDELLA